MERQKRIRVDVGSELKHILDFITKQLNRGSEAESLRDYILKRMDEKTDEIKKATHDHYAAQYSIRYIHSQILQLMKNQEHLIPSATVANHVEQIIRCSLMVTGPTNVGKSSFINEILEIPIRERFLTPELSVHCTEKVLLIQDNEALSYFTGGVQSKTSDKGSIAIIENAFHRKHSMEKDGTSNVLTTSTEDFREIRSVSFDTYDSLARVTKHLIGQTVKNDQEETVELNETFKRKDILVRVSNYRNILSSGLQVVDLPGSNRNENYVNCAMQLVKPTVCLWLSSPSKFSEFYDSEYIHRLQEQYKERCNTRFIVAIGSIDGTSINFHDYMERVRTVALGMEKAMGKENGCIFTNRLIYSVEEEDFDLLGISTVKVQDVKDGSLKLLTENNRTKCIGWFLMQNWMSLMEDIAREIKNHTSEYVRGKSRLFEQALNTLISDLRCTLQDANSAHHETEKIARKLQSHVELAESCQSCLQKTAEEIVTNWKPKTEDLIKEWYNEKEIDDLMDKTECYQLNSPHRRIITDLLNAKIGDKIKHLILITTDRSTIYLTRSFFDNFSRHAFHEDYSQKVSKLYVRLQSIGYAANELPISMDFALKVLAEFYSVRCLFEKTFFSSFNTFIKENKSYVDELQRSVKIENPKITPWKTFIDHYTRFLVEECLPVAKKELLEIFHQKIVNIFKSSTTHLESRQRNASTKMKMEEAKAKELHHLIDCRLLPYCCYLNMCLASVCWQFSDEDGKTQFNEHVRKPGRHLISYARKLVESKMLLDGLCIQNIEMENYFVILKSWRYDRRLQTIHVRKKGYVKSAMEWLLSQQSVPGLRKRYKYGLDILRGLKAMHGLNYVLDDFSPANIFLSEDESRALIDLETTRNCPFEKLKLTKFDTVPPIHLHPDRFQGSTNPSKIFDLYSYSTILWFIMDGTGTTHNLPMSILSAKSCSDLESALRLHILNKPQNCDHSLYQQMKDCWRLTNKGRKAIGKVEHVMNRIEKHLQALIEH